MKHIDRIVRARIDTPPPPSTTTPAAGHLRSFTRHVQPPRDEARRFLIDAWTKHRTGAPLSDLEGIVVQIVALHPEYHPMLEEPEKFAHRDFAPEAGETNPYLHLSLHLAVAEQLAIDQPPGIRAQFERIRDARGDEHAALHAVLECLGEVMWSAQRHGTPPDAALYLTCLERQA